MFENADWDMLLRTSPSEGEVFALQSVIRHFMRLGYLERDDLHKKTTLEKAQVTSFLNRVQGDKANRTQFAALVPYVAGVFETHARKITDPFVLNAVRTALRHPDLGMVARSGNFEIEHDLVSWIRVDGERVIDATKMLSGMWLVARLSSATPSDPNVPEFNISLVNIDPHQIAEDLRLPRFKHYVNGRGRDPAQAEVFEGFVMVDDRHVYLLGRKRRTTSLQPELFSFHYVPAEGVNGEAVPKLPAFQGHGNSVASSRGQIGVYYLAEFVEGSHELEAEAFEQKKLELIDKIGVFTKSQIEESGLLSKTDRLSSLLERSRNHSIFMDD